MATDKELSDFLASIEKRAFKQAAYGRILDADTTIIGGDFNTLDGDDELAAFMEELSLRNANLYNTPTFPSWNAEKQLDFILYSPEIRPLDFRVADVRFSDHLPVVFDFELK